MEELHRYIASQESVTYLKVKALLVDKFGKQAFAEHKGKASSASAAER